MKNGIETYMTGIIDDKHIAFIEAQLSDDPQALKLLKEFTDPENLINPSAVSKVIADIRHRVYELGLDGGANEIEERAIAINGASDDGDGEQYQQKLVWKSARAILSLAKLSPERRNEALGMIRGRYLKPPLEQIKHQYFTTDGDIQKPTMAGTPLNELLWIIALSDQARSEGTETTWLARARRSAGEHLIRNLMTSDEKLISLASGLFSARYYEAIFEQMPEALSNGKIGGKALGYLIGNAGIEYDDPEFDEKFASERKMTTKQLKGKLKFPECLSENHSEFIGSGVFEQTIQCNKPLAKAPMIKEFYANEDGITEEEKQERKTLHKKIENAWQNAQFPPHIERQLKMLFAKRHGRPIIVRSSSELEDRHGASFAGQYKSFELANSGGFERDFQAFKTAVMEIYASVYSQGVMVYRDDIELLREDEEMGILIQDLVGEKQGEYFAPHFSVVGMSKATQGLQEQRTNGTRSARNSAIKIAAGLGRTIVDQSGRSRYVELAKPTATFKEQEALPQYEMYALNMQSGKIEKVTGRKIWDENNTAHYQYIDGETGNFSFTTILNSNVPLRLEYIIEKLKHLLGCDVDCEFALQYSTEKQDWMIQLVQCRPQNIPKNLVPSRMPSNIPKNHVIMATQNSINGTMISDATYVIYIDPKIFNDCLPQERQEVQKYIAVINDRLKKEEKYLIIAPRSWGSSDGDSSGLPVKYEYFNHASGIIEVCETGESKPSFGAHFFQIFGDRSIAFSSASHRNFPHHDAYPDGQNFFQAAPHAERVPSITDITSIDTAIANKLAPYIKVININQAYHALYGGRENDEVTAHLAQDNTSDRDTTYPATLYFAKKGKDKPIPVRELTES